MRYNLLGLCGVLLLSGCGERSDKLDFAPDIVGRAKLGKELLFVDRTDSVIHALNVTDKKLASSVERLDIPAEPSLATERPGSDEVLVLCAGERDENYEWVEAPALARISTNHKVRRYDLTVPFSKMELSEDGRYALLHAPSEDESSADLLSNPNRVALVDLDSEPSEDNPVERTLKAIGGELSSAFLTEPLRIKGSTRPVGVFAFPDGVSVWDLTHPERPEIGTDGLAAGGEVAILPPVADPENGQLYLIQTGLPDLRVADLNGISEDKQNDFWPSWNQLTVGSYSASDLVLYTEDDEARALVAVDAELRVVDAPDNRVTAIAVPSSITALYSFVGTSPDDTVERQRILGWSQNHSVVTFLELEQLESRGTRNLETLELGSSLSGLIPLNDTQLLTVFEGANIGVLDLESRRFTPLSSSVELAQPLIQNDGERVWVGGTGTSQIGYFGPNSLETWSMGLDVPIEEMFLFETDSASKIVVTHESPWGLTTVVDGTNPSRATSTVLDGFLLDGLVK